MKTQNQIKRTLSEETNLLYLKDLLDSKTFPNRAELVKEVCRKFNFYDPKGQAQISGCAKALRILDVAGHIKLPATARKTAVKRSPQRLNTPVSLPVDVPSAVNEIQGLELILVQTTDEIQIWNELMIQEHPLGSGTFVGRQLRYLINSSHGYLGGVGFAAPALQLSDRDKWIGWDKEQRQAHLHLLVGMSRFLIRKSVRCSNLASKALSLSINTLVPDFENRYGYKPLLIESFVDEAWSGTCYQAANWIKIGQTKGRGRQDKHNQYALSRKTIYVYPVDHDFRQTIGLSENAGLGALKLTEGLDSKQWAEHEFGGAPLGDTRLSKRLVTIAQAKGESPGRAFSGAVNGDWPATKAYYRMIDQPDGSAVNLTNIIEPHRRRTARRMMDQKTVLCIQDGSELNYTNLDQCRDLGVLKANQTGAKTKGMNLHSTFTVTTSGLPLGILKSQCLSPKEKDRNDKRKPSAIPIEEKKTYVWIEHHRDLVELSKEIPQTQLVDVCDREADFFELFDEQRQNPGVDLLVRASHNRNIKQEPFKLFTAVREKPVQGRVRVPIPKESARPKKSKQKARKARPARLADCAIRILHLELPAPEYSADKKPVELCVVHALEEEPLPETDPVEWFLLTTMNVVSSSDAEQCLRWYTLRWRIEDWHRVLKSGCRIDDLANETAERLRRAIGINLVIAWRIMLMTLLGRETPELPAEVLFSDVELRTLRAYAKKKG
ncbi:MAG: IS4 family transposase [Gammaproteobacteria bacterium]|nr:IS4 family transposase [Gammaproteobacteria bacterium]